MCTRTFNWGINLHMNDVTCVSLSVTLCSTVTFLTLKKCRPVVLTSVPPLCLDLILPPLKTI